MKILITGATGFIGRRLCHRLFSQGHSLVLLGRDLNKLRRALPFPENQCVFQEWQPQKGNPSPKAWEGVEAVIHLAGESIGTGFWSRRKKKEILDSRVLGTRHLLAAVREQKTVRVFIGASAVGYYGDSFESEFTESSPPGEGFLAEVCQAWESAVREGLSEEPRIRSVVLRFGIVLGKNGGLLGQLIPWFKAAVFPAGDPHQWMSWIAIEDLVNLIQTAVQDSRYSGVLNAVAPHPVQAPEFYRTLAQELRKPYFPLFPPRFILKAALREKSSLVCSSQKVIPQALLRVDFQFQCPTLQDAIAREC